MVCQIPTYYTHPSKPFANSGYMIYADPEPSEKYDYWRAYTVSLLVQNSMVMGDEQEVLVKHDSDSLRVFLTKRLNLGIGNDKKLNDKLLSIITDLRALSVDLKCQRARYKVDDSIKIGDVFDENKMIDLDCNDCMDGGIMNVRGIVSDRVICIRSGLDGASSDESQICKARVLVSLSPYASTTKSKLNVFMYF